MTDVEEFRSALRDSGARLIIVSWVLRQEGGTLRTPVGNRHGEPQRPLRVFRLGGILVTLQAEVAQW